MIILIAGLFVAAIALAIYALMPPERKPQARPLENETVLTRITNEPLVLRLEEQVNSLNTELEQLKLEHQKLENELLLANKLVIDLKDELSKHRMNSSVDQSEVKRLQKENVQLETGLLDKSKELEKEINLGLSLQRELNENKDKIICIEKENKILSEKIKALESTAAEISELKPKINTEEMISKKEYDELKEKFNQAEEVLRIVHGGAK